MTTEHRGLLKIDLDLLAELVHLPPGNKVAAIRMDDAIERNAHTASLLIVGDDMPEVPENEVTPWVSLEFTQADDGTVSSRWAHIKEVPV